VKLTFGSDLVLSFEHWNFDIVSDFGFRYSNLISTLSINLEMKQGQSYDL